MILPKTKYHLLYEKINKHPIENIRLVYYLKFVPERIEKIFCDDENSPKAAVVEIKEHGFMPNNTAVLWAENSAGLEWLKDWQGVDYTLMFTATQEKIYDFIRDKWEVEGSPAELWYLPNDVEIGKGEYIVQPLKDRHEDIEEVNQNWHYAKGYIYDYVRDKISEGATFAVYVDDKLASYAVYRENGAMGMLRTLPEYRGKGIAKSITYAMIKDIRKQGRIPHCFVVPENAASQNVVTKCGFVKGGKYFWIWKEMFCS